MEISTPKSTIISVTLMTLKTLNTLEAFSLTDVDHAKLDAFQIRGLRQILCIKQLFWSRVANKDIMIQANVRARLPPGNNIIKISDRLIRKQLTLFGHILRASPTDTINTCSVKPNGERVKADFRRVGRPRLKWYDGVRQYAISELIKLQIIIAHWRTIMRPEQLTKIILEAAQ
eukprot:7524519-Heterocapsa_arctica.AAC.1